MNKQTNMNVKKASRWVAASLGFWFLTAASVEGSVVKVAIGDSGFYRITKAELAQAFSITESQVQTSAFWMENVGRPVSVARDAGDLVFFGHKYESIYTDANIYFLGIGSGPVVQDQVVAPASGQPQSSFPAQARHEQQLALRSDLVRVPGEDPWLWKLMISGFSSKQFTIPLNLPGVIAGSEASVAVKVKGATDSTGRYYHGAQIKVNGTVVGYDTFDGFEAAEIVATIPSGLLQASGNTLTIYSLPPSGTFYDSIYFDSAVVSYQRSYQSGANQMIVDAQPGSVKLENLSSSAVQIWNVSDVWNPSRLTGYQVVADGTAWDASFESPSAARYAVSVAGEMKPVVGISPVYAQSLKDPTNAVDYLLVVGPGLESAAQTLASYRAANGLRTMMVSIDAVYDAFNFGIRDGRALRSLLGYATRQWAECPRYVTIAGDGSLDYRNYLGFNDSLVPTEATTDIYGLYSTDHLAVDLTGTSSIQIAIGRIPAQNAAELTAYINNLIAFEAGGAYRNDILISTDNADLAGNYLSDGNQLEAIAAAKKTAHRADIDIIGAAQTRQEFIHGVEAGKELAVYIGHGTSQQFAEEAIFTINDVNAMTNQTSPSMFMVLGCLSGGFGAPGMKEIGESLVTKLGASPATIGAATYVNSLDSLVLATQIMHAVYNNGVERLGDAWVDAKNQLLLFNRMSPVRGFQLLGDAAISLGASDAPRGVPATPPVVGSFDEWESWALPPVVADLDLPNGPQDDTDGDGDDNWTEYVNGTDPGSADSFLRIQNLRQLSGIQKVEVEWPSAHGRTYRLERSYSADHGYSPVAEGITASAPLNFWEDDLQTGNVAFYRVVVEQ
ncbi:MAG: hypothetical protein KDL10_00720 [Kiritimatiellae bacterium]|nr:hypothetical protein [Kiritimatiellia bacterium]